MRRCCYTCSRPITDEEYESYDPLSKTEYGLSGMCLGCQDEVFLKDYDWTDDDGDWDDDADGVFAVA